MSCLYLDISLPSYIDITACLVFGSLFNLATTLPQILPSLQDVDFSLFYDAANVWGLDYSKTKSEGSKIRSSIGLAIDYFTPLGPLNFSYTEVLSQDAGDVTETFRFNLGTTF